MFIDSDFRAARKVHLCSFCRRGIAPGVFYRKGTRIDSGTVYSWKEHISCGMIAYYWEPDPTEDILFGVMPDMTLSKCVRIVRSRFSRMLRYEVQQKKIPRLLSHELCILKDTWRYMKARQKKLG